MADFVPLKERKKIIGFFKGNDVKFSQENHVLDESELDKIICGDCLSVLKQFPDNCIDMILTSPPYNFGITYDVYDDVRIWDDYYDFLYSCFKEFVRVLKYGGRIAINVQPAFSQYSPTHHIITNMMIEFGMLWKCEFLWNKNNYGCNTTTFGSWRSPSNPYFRHVFEYINVYCKGTYKKEGDSSLSDISAKDFKDWTNTYWVIAPEQQMKQFSHPAMFPSEVVKRLLQLFSYQQDVILDPFNGAGTTTYVCKILNRRYIGIDISEQYCEEAKRRIESLLI